MKKRWVPEEVQQTVLVLLRPQCKSKYPVTGQFTDIATRDQSSSRLVILRTSQLAETFDLKFAVNNHYKYDLRQTTLLNTFNSR